MACRTVRIISSALKGVPFHVRSIRRAEPKEPARFDVVLTIDDVSILRPRERALMKSAVTFVIEPGATTTRMHGVVTAVSQVEQAHVGGASLRLSVVIIVISGMPKLQG